MNIEILSDTGYPGNIQKKKSNFYLQAVSYLIVSLGALGVALPFLWMLSTSFKEPAHIFSFPPQWLPIPLTLQNYHDALTILPFNRFLFNTVFVAVLVIAGQLLSCSLGAYAFAKLRFPGSSLIFSMYLSTLMVPEIVTIIPNFVLIKNLNWIDTYQALIVPNLFGTAFGTFLLRQFFIGLPDELMEAAKLDGCGTLRTIFRIVMPLSKPALTSLGIFTLVKVWNDFMWPLTVINSTDKKTLAIGLTSFQGLVVSNWGIIMAGAVYTMIPLILLFLFAQRYFIEGIALTGIK
jgi:ABC-type sugar transport system, permease component